MVTPHALSQRVPCLFSDGTIDWDEFSTYMLLESQGSARVREFESIVTMQVSTAPPHTLTGGDCVFLSMHEGKIKRRPHSALFFISARRCTCAQPVMHDQGWQLWLASVRKVQVATLLPRFASSCCRAAIGAISHPRPPGPQGRHDPHHHPAVSQRDRQIRDVRQVRRAYDARQAGHRPSRNRVASHI